MGCFCSTDLTAKQQRETPIAKGDTFPHFTLPNTDGGTTSSRQILKEGKHLIVVFYRGGWCPFCNLYLHSIQKKYESISGLGAEVVAIAPEKLSGVAKTKEARTLSFPVCQDFNNTFAKELGTAYDASSANKLVHTLSTTNTMIDPTTGKVLEGDETLAIPATFVIRCEDQIVVAEDVEKASMAMRMGVKGIVRALEGITAPVPDEAKP